MEIKCYFQPQTLTVGKYLIDENVKFLFEVPVEYRQITVSLLPPMFGHQLPANQIRPP